MPVRRERASRPFLLARKASLALEILIAYARIHWWLWRTDLPHTIEALRGSRLEEVGGAFYDDVTALRLGRAVTRTLGMLPADSSCLVRSLVLATLLARRGIRSSLVIGVTSEPEFAAHAWIESGDIALLPRNGAMFEQLVRL